MSIALSKSLFQLNTTAHYKQIVSFLARAMFSSLLLCLHPVTICTTGWYPSLCKFPLNSADLLHAFRRSYQRLHPLLLAVCQLDSHRLLLSRPTICSNTGIKRPRLDAEDLGGKFRGFCFCAEQLCGLCSVNGLDLLKVEEAEGRDPPDEKESVVLLVMSATVKWMLVREARASFRATGFSIRDTCVSLVNLRRGSKSTSSATLLLLSTSVVRFGID